MGLFFLALYYIALDSFDECEKITQLTPFLSCRKKTVLTVSVSL